MRLAKIIVRSLAAGTAILLLAGCNGSGKQAGTATPAKNLDEADLSVLTAQNHPRLFLNNTDLKSIRKSLKKNPLLANLHEQMMEQAAQYGLSEEPLIYKKDASNKRILHISGVAITRIASAAYAYRVTGDKKYLAHAEKDLNDVCNFPDWNPSHYLDTGEMSLAVAIGYDWLYDVLSPETKKLIEDRLQHYAFDTAEGQGFYKGVRNWNQVCNGGLVSGALAILETDPERCKAMLAKSIESNKGALYGSYYPDGAFPEGSSYWGYGTMFQCIMIAAVQSCLGSDLGMSESQGFDKTADYMLQTVGTSNLVFNYSDCGKRLGANTPMWYFAERFDKPYVLFFEKDALENHRYVRNRSLFLALSCAVKLQSSEIPTPTEHFFHADGLTPVAMMRTGWDKEDLYLGIKGGKARDSHSHMDAGNFVFDAYGYRWADDYGQPPYARLESFFQSIGKGEGDLWKMTQDSQRWDLFAYNNKQHNVITINDSKFDVDGFCPVTATEDTPERMSATLDLTPLYFGNVASAVRTAAIVDKAYLEVKDELKGGAKPAHVRWTLVTYGKPEIGPDGIVLTQGEVKMKLQASGAKVSYTSWPTDAASMGLDGKDFVDLVEGSYIVGFEFDLPKNADLTLVTTLKKL